ncbi:MAG TPA: 1-acyl-sn-glycerol-3-phosphate acyltransferase [Chitinophagaceae bacterium]|nr:1-acyl-sn-glycerol-3-phosphate acyltransferase [Chitinophagaceae bacterium]
MDTSTRPMILACSHPNSFFDALVMGAYHPRRMHFLARGDAFKNQLAAKLLRMLNMIPIYRLSEGKENLDNNQHTFDECIEVFRNNGCVLIFSEGVCVNEWRLRPLKKGTARLAWMCWEEEGVKNMIVQPVGLNYHSFTRLPKRVAVQFSPVIQSFDLDLDSPAIFYKDFNEHLAAKLEPLVLEAEHPLLKNKKSDVTGKMLLAVPALLGFLLHKPFYNAWRKFIWSKTKEGVFFDSVFFASLLIVYPFLVLLVTIVVVMATGSLAWWLLLLALPFTAWCYKQFKAV